jgi:S-layer family protein/putative pyrroloquinoline-quinone-binding quinoprotein
MTTKLNKNRRITCRAIALSTLLISLTVVSARMRADVATVGTCSGEPTYVPFTDVASNNIFFCAIAEAYFSGLTNGTTPTTYSPSSPVSREQMAAFVTRTMDQSLKRGSQRAALGQWWTQQFISSSALTSVGAGPIAVQSDGECLWVADRGSTTVKRVRANDGKLIETWTGMDHPSSILVANGRVYVTGDTAPGKLYAIDPDLTPGNAVQLAEVGDNPVAMAFDGERILTANRGGSITNYHVSSGSKITYTNNFSMPNAILYDGSNFWVTDEVLGSIRKVLITGQVFQDTSLNTTPLALTFDGTNLWITGDDKVTVLRQWLGNHKRSRL